MHLFFRKAKSVFFFLSCHRHNATVRPPAHYQADWYLFRGSANLDRDGVGQARGAESILAGKPNPSRPVHIGPLRPPTLHGTVISRVEKIRPQVLL